MRRINILLFIFIIIPNVAFANEIISFEGNKFGVETHNDGMTSQDRSKNTLVDEYYVDGSIVMVYKTSDSGEEYLTFVDVYREMIPYIENIADEEEQLKEAMKLMAQTYYQNDAVFDLNVIFNKENEYLQGELDVSQSYKKIFYKLREYVLNELKKEPEILVSNEEIENLKEINSEKILEEFEVSIKEKDELIKLLKDDIKKYKLKTMFIPLCIAIAFIMLILYFIYAARGRNGGVNYERQT